MKRETNEVSLEIILACFLEAFTVLLCSKGDLKLSMKLTLIETTKRLEWLEFQGQNINKEKAS